MSPPEARNSESRPDHRNPVVQYLTTNPIAAGFLTVVMLAGAVAGFIALEGILTTPRSILGGALGGFGCWLLVMIGRAIGH